MRKHAPFSRSDLDHLGRLYDQADKVVSMRDVFAGETGAATIGLRHDVDDNPGSLDTAVEMARWEHDRGHTSTFFLLHHSHYWDDVRDAAREIVQLNHEVGLHVNAVAEAIRQRREPHTILTEALYELRCAVPVTGVVAHGDSLCRGRDGTVRFCNDEMFVECRRRDMGAHDRTIDGITLDPRSLWDYGLKYDANWLPRTAYLSDSGGRWSRPFHQTETGFPFAGQLHMLVHPDWWQHAFVPVEATA